MPRFTIDFTDIDDTLLTDIAKQKGVNKVEIVRRALALYLHIQQRMQPGMQLNLTDADGNQVSEIVFI